MDHSDAVDDATANAGLVDDPSVINTITELVMTTRTTTQSFTTTHLITITQTVASTVLVTVTANINPVMQNSSTMHPSPIQTSSASSSCSPSDEDNTPIYIAIVIVVVGLLIAVILVIVGVILCRQLLQKSSQSVRPKSPVIAANKSAENGSIVVEVSNDLYGKEPASR